MWSNLEALTIYRLVLSWSLSGSFCKLQLIIDVLLSLTTFFSQYYLLHEGIFLGDFQVTFLLYLKCFVHVHFNLWCRLISWLSDCRRYCGCCHHLHPCCTHASWLHLRCNAQSFSLRGIHARTAYFFAFLEFEVLGLYYAHPWFFLQLLLECINHLSPRLFRLLSVLTLFSRCNLRGLWFIFHILEEIVSSLHGRINHVGMCITLKERISLYFQLLLVLKSVG